MHDVEKSFMAARCIVDELEEAFDGEGTGFCFNNEDVDVNITQEAVVISD